MSQANQLVAGLRTIARCESMGLTRNEIRAVLTFGIDPSRLVRKSVTSRATCDADVIAEERIDEIRCA